MCLVGLRALPEIDASPEGRERVVLAQVMEDEGIEPQYEGGMRVTDGHVLSVARRVFQEANLGLCNRCASAHAIGGLAPCAAIAPRTQGLGGTMPPGTYPSAVPALRCMAGLRRWEHLAARSRAASSKRRS